MRVAQFGKEGPKHDGVEAALGATMAGSGRLLYVQIYLRLISSASRNGSMLRQASAQQEVGREMDCAKAVGEEQGRHTEKSTDVLHQFRRSMETQLGFGRDCWRGDSRTDAFPWPLVALHEGVRWIPGRDKPAAKHSSSGL